MAEVGEAGRVGVHARAKHGLLERAGAAGPLQTGALADRA
jgi:hypothetical protein